MSEVRKACEQVGISPKVLVPVVLQIVVGAILLLTGHDVEGKTLLFTALGTFGAGYTANPGEVKVVQGPGGAVNPAAGDVRGPE